MAYKTVLQLFTAVPAQGIEDTLSFGEFSSSMESKLPQLLHGLIKYAPLPHLRKKVRQYSIDRSILKQGIFSVNLNLKNHESLPLFQEKSPL